MENRIIPRPYQEECVEAMFASMRSGNEFGLVVLPTGAGKTIIFSRFVEEVYRRYGGARDRIRVCIAAHREKLVSQARQKLLRVWPESLMKIGMACATYSHDVDIDSEIIICSIQTLLSRLRGKGPELEPFNIILVDECHRMPPREKASAYRTLVELTGELSPRRKVFGFTASPYRLGHGWIYGGDCRKGFSNWFSEPVYRLSLDRMIADGYLVPYRIKQAVDIGPDLRSVPVVRGEYRSDLLGQVMCKFIDSAVRAFNEYGEERRHAIAFCVNIGHADALAEAFRKSGIAAASVHSKMPDGERQRRLDAFSRGECRVLASVDALIEGWDETCVDCVMMLRPTKSPMIYVQQGGRGLRLHEGKTDLLVLDMADNAASHGFFSDPVVRVPGDKAPGEAPVKICPDCGEALRASVRTCPVCGHVFPGRKIEEPDRVEMREIEYKADAPGGCRVVDLEKIEITLDEGVLCFKFYEKEGRKPLAVRSLSKNDLASPGFERKWRTLTRLNNVPRSMSEAYALASKIEFPLKAVFTAAGGAEAFCGFYAFGWPVDPRPAQTGRSASVFRREPEKRLPPVPQGLFSRHIDSAAVARERGALAFVFAIAGEGEVVHRITSERVSRWNFGREWKTLTNIASAPSNLDEAWSAASGVRFPGNALLRREGRRLVFCGFHEQGWTVNLQMDGAR